MTDGKAKQVAKALRSRPGVTMVDVVEGPPDVVLMVEALNRQKLARFTVEALALVELMTEDICLLPVHNGLKSPSKKRALNKKSLKRETRHACWETYRYTC